MAKLTDEAATVSSPRHVLPKDLPNAISHLGDEELEPGYRPQCPTLLFQSIEKN
jgi:hypothetical protein